MRWGLKGKARYNGAHTGNAKYYDTDNWQVFARVGLGLDSQSKPQEMRDTGAKSDYVRDFLTEPKVYRLEWHMPNLKHGGGGFDL